MLKLEKIKEGLVVANYPAMCELLEEQVMKGGKSKQLQLQRWRKYFDWENDGHKFIITKIRENPLPQKIYKNDLYTEKILNIVCKNLFEENNKDSHYTSNDLLLMCGFINNNYYFNERNNCLKRFVNKFGCTYKQAQYLFNKLDEHNKSYSLRVLENGLKRLAERKIITFEIIHILRHTNSKNFCVATPEEESNYNIIYNEVKKRLGIDYVNFYNKRKLYDEINIELLKIGIGEFYKVYRINLGLNSNAQNITNEAVKNSKEYINTKIYKKMLEYIDVDIEKQIKKAMSIELSIDDDLEEIFNVDEYIEKEIEKINGTKPIKEALVDFYIKIQ